MTLPIRLRWAEPSDESFIVYSWVESYYDGPMNTHFTPDGDRWRAYDKQWWWKIYQPVVKDILSREGVKVSVACLESDPNVVLGWLCYEPGVVHYLTTKYRFDEFKREIQDALVGPILDKPIMLSHYLVKFGRPIPEKWTLNPLWMLEEE